MKESTNPDRGAERVDGDSTHNRGGGWFFMASNQGGRATNPAFTRRRVLPKSPNGWMKACGMAVLRRQSWGERDGESEESSGVVSGPKERQEEFFFPSDQTKSKNQRDAQRMGWSGKKKEERTKKKKKRKNDEGGTD